MTDIIEIMAKATYAFGEEDSGNDNGPFDDLPPEMQEFCRGMARACLTALSEAGWVVKRESGECICPACGLRHGGAVVTEHPF